LVLESEIPEDHPQKRAIEDALREVVGGLPGSWKVTISRARIGHWLALRIEGPGLDWTLIMDAGDQNPEFIHHRIGAVLWAGGLGGARSGDGAARRES
jgi:hypothetical protein